MCDYEETFDRTDAGASNTFPMSMGEIKKGGYMCIENRPCKVIDLTFHKTGKHGGSKASVVGIDIFNGRKKEDSLMSSSNVDVPNICRKEYTCLSIDDEGFLSLLNPNTNEMRNDLKLPDETESDVELSKRLQKSISGGREISISVIAAMGIEKIIDFKEE